MGTAQYLSPEQARGAPVTAASDVYSVGIVLYEMLTGDVPFRGDTPVEIAMKHLNEPPHPPSAVAPGIPADLDRIVLRALAKDPAERYASAEEIDSDLARIEAGLPIARETTDAATAILSRPAVSSTAATQIRPPETTPVQPPRPPRRPPPYDPYGGRPPKRKRSIVPWLVVAILLAAAGIAGWYVYQEVQSQLEESKPVAVPNVVGIKQQLAIKNIEDAELVAKVQRQADEEVPEGIVIEQRPGAGTRIAKGETVTIVVSTGVPQVTVPKVSGLPVEDAIQTLNGAGLRANVKEVFSEKYEPGIVMFQDPKPNTEADKGSTVTLTVSKGVEQVEVPNVIGFDQASAEATLTDAGLVPNAVVVESGEPAGTVVGQSPNGGLVPKGTEVEIDVSAGPPPPPETVAVPGVTGLTEEEATQILSDAGFQVEPVDQPTLNPLEDGIVLSQDPLAGDEVEPGTTVTILVGRFL